MYYVLGLKDLLPQVWAILTHQRFVLIRPGQHKEATTSRRPSRGRTTDSEYGIIDQRFTVIRKQPRGGCGGFAYRFTAVGIKPRHDQLFASGMTERMDGIPKTALQGLAIDVKIVYSISRVNCIGQLRLSHILFRYRFSVDLPGGSGQQKSVPSFTNFLWF